MQLFIAAFESVPDPRAENTRHNLVEILIIAFIAVLCGAQNCSEMAEFGREKVKFLKRFLKLRHGIPSHDTFSTVFRMLDPKALDAAFGRITARLVAALAKGGVIAIDGKSLKRAYDKGEKSSPRMMVSAYAAGLRLTLATVTAKDRNEVDAALEVLGLIDLEGKIVTGDALHCNRRMVETIVDKGGDYCIALKGNQESLLSDARACLSAADKPKAGKRPPPTAKTETKGHGRIETRVGVVVRAKGLAEYHEFPGHWQIENALHWQLDVSFGEDAQRNRKDNGPANIAVLRRRALDVARLDQSKGSLTVKLKRAGWYDEFMLKLLCQMR